MRNKNIKLPFYRKWGGTRLGESALRVEDQLFECNALLAPDHPDEGKCALELSYTYGMFAYMRIKVKLNCVLKSDLNKVPKNAFVKRNRPSDGAEYVELHYNLHVENNQSGLMKFSLEINGKEYSAVEASY